MRGWLGFRGHAQATLRVVTERARGVGARRWRAALARGVGARRGRAVSPSRSVTAACALGRTCEIMRHMRGSHGGAFTTAALRKDEG